MSNRERERESIIFSSTALQNPIADCSFVFYKTTQSQVGEFFNSISTCHFPDSLLRQTIGPSSGPPPTPTHVLLISDPMIPHPTLSYPYSSPIVRRLRVWMSDLYMRKSWNVIMRLGRIDAVIVAGDMMNWGRGVFNDEE